MLKNWGISWQTQQQPTQQPTTQTNTGQTNTDTGTTNTSTSTGNQTATSSDLSTAQIVPGVAQGSDQINIADAAGQLATDPGLLFNDQMKQSQNLPQITNQQVQDASINDNSLTQQNPITAGTAAQATQTQATAPTEKPAADYTAKQTQQDVANQDMTGKTGQITSNDLVDPNQLLIDEQGAANGTSPLGQALNDFAHINMSNIIDTSTSSGKLLAKQLGTNNYVDSKATLEGQLQLLQQQFTDPNTGQPVIPAWAAGTARQVSRIASFSGMTGTAATAAMAQAIMEASLPIAQQDAQFFQTLTIKNLDNQQQQVINKANVLANISTANLDARTQAAVTNAQHFMQMDMANLSNEQQAAAINTQDRVQSILQDANAVNTQRMFTAQSQQQQDQFYDQLGASISQFNADQANSMSMYNAGQINAQDQFNAQLENNRDQFYKTMQYNIDVANANWRQNVTLTQNQEAFQAMQQDVQNMVGLSNEQLNQLWDRADSLLDYAWKTADNTAQRQNNLAVVALHDNNTAAQADQEGWGKILGSVVCTAASSIFGGLFTL